VRICRVRIAFIRSILFRREVASSQREISAVRHAPQALTFIFRTCAMSDVLLGWIPARGSRQTTWENEMTWKTPKIVEVPVGMEINMYACAARK
jgi:coenzyme PQQ precursor peptide PqqA